MDLDLKLYTEDAPVLPENRKASWLLMGQGKLKLESELQKYKLSLQSILKPTAEGLKAYKAEYTKMVELRQSFTGILDTVKESCMAIEKEMDPKTNEAYKKAATDELAARELEAQKLKDQQAEADAVAKFRADVINEYHRLTTEYRSALATTINQSYVDCLKAKSSPDDAKKAIQAAHAAILSTVIPASNKLNRGVLTLEKATQVYNSIPKPNYTQVRDEALTALNEKFAMYPEDLANAEQRAKQTEMEFTQSQQQAKTELENVQAVTTLMGSGDAYVATPSGFKGVTETTQILIKDADETFVFRILAAFLANGKLCFPKLKVSKYSQLNIGQMAKALDAASVKVDGVEYETIKK